MSWLETPAPFFVVMLLLAWLYVRITCGAYRSRRQCIVTPEGWVPSKDRLPGDNVPCLCVWRGERRVLWWNAYYNVWDGAAGGEDYVCAALDVSHWMPLPPLP